MMWMVVVVVVVAAKDAQSAQTREMTRGLEAALEPGTVVVLREGLAAPEDEDLGALAQALHADAVAAVTWTDGDRRHVRLHVRRTGDPIPAVRDLEFKPSDPSIERARAAAFAIAAMMPHDEVTPEARLPPPTPPTPSPPPRPPAPAEPAVEPSAATPPGNEDDRPWALDLALVGMLGAGGDAPGLGGDIRLRRRLSSVVEGGVAVSVTRGTIAAAQATFTLVRPRLGVGVKVLQRGNLSFVARIEAGPWLHGVASYTGPTSSDSRWVFVTNASGELALSLGRAFGLFVDSGADVASGTTRVLVGGEERASIPRVRLVTTLGVSLHF
jgi:hypothetical protein